MINFNEEKNNKILITRNVQEYHDPFLKIQFHKFLFIPDKE